MALVHRETLGVNRTFVALDFETANFKPSSACAIGIVLVENGKIIAQEHYLIQPPTNKFSYTHIHGICLNDVADAGDFQDVWRETKHLFKAADFVAAHNAAFDRRVLKETMAYYGMKPFAKPFACTLKLARNDWGMKSAKLSDVCKLLKIPLQHHDALSDARACAKVAVKGLKSGWQPF